MGLIGLDEECNALLGDVVNVEVDSLKAITDVRFQELNGAKGWVGQYELTQDSIKDVPKLHDL